MYGLNAISLIFFSGISVLAVWLCKCRERTRERTLRILCLVLLAFNLARYALPPLLGDGLKVPVEFSAVAYFSVPAILLTGRRKALSWAAYSGLIAGFVYYMTMIFAGGSIYYDYPPYTIYISLFCHGTLYLCGMVVIGTRKCPTGDRFTMLAGVAVVAVRALLMRPLTDPGERLFIYELLDGVYIRQLLPEAAWPVALPVYYIAMIGLIYASIKIFFKLNLSQSKRYVKLRGPRMAAPREIAQLDTAVSIR